MNYEAIKKAAEAYKPDMVKFLRDMIAIPSESCEEEGVVKRIAQELTKLGYENVGFDGLGNPFFFTQIIGFCIFMIAVQAELGQTPFDMPIAESELVTGYITEYSGLRFLLFFIGEFASAGAFAAVAATLFLGGWAVPAAWADLDSAIFNLLGPIIMLTKMMILGGLIFFVRFTFPRFREDQLQKLAWTVLIPISLANILATTILKVAF